jgi:response regulator of citrate/malate metabolism
MADDVESPRAQRMNAVRTLIAIHRHRNAVFSASPHIDHKALQLMLRLFVQAGQDERVFRESAADSLNLSNATVHRYIRFLIGNDLAARQQSGMDDPTLSLSAHGKRLVETYAGLVSETLAFRR